MLDNASMASPIFELREYRREDLESIFQLDQICFTAEFRFDRGSMRRFAEAGNAISLVAEYVTGSVTNQNPDDGPRLVAGFVIVHLEWPPAGRCGYVVTLDVAPELRREGLAGRMMDTAELRVKQAGAAFMELHVFAGNEAAIRFYEGRGYVRLGTQRGFYGRGLDAQVYRKRLG